MATQGPITTPLTTLLGIKHPIILAGMARTSGGPLAAAVSNAGGLGCIGGLGYTPQQYISSPHPSGINLTNTLQTPRDNPLSQSQPIRPLSPFWRGSRSPQSRRGRSRHKPRLYPRPTRCADRRDHRRRRTTFHFRRWDSASARHKTITRCRNSRDEYGWSS